MLNIMVLIQKGGYRLDFMLAFVAFLTWMKCLLQFRVTMSFGPMFKIMYQMVIELVKFIIIWVMVLLTFSCCSLLVFGQAKSEVFSNFQNTIIYYFESSLGNFDFKLCCKDDDD